MQGGHYRAITGSPLAAESPEAVLAAVLQLSLSLCLPDRGRPSKRHPQDSWAETIASPRCPFRTHITDSCTSARIRSHVASETGACLTADAACSLVAARVLPPAQLAG